MLINSQYLGMKFSQDIPVIILSLSLNFTYKRRKYLTIIEHIFYFIIPFFLPEFKLYSCICPLHEQVRSWCRLYTRTIDCIVSIRWLNPECIERQMFIFRVNWLTIARYMEVSVTICMKIPCPLPALDSARFIRSYLIEKCIGGMSAWLL